MKSIVLLYSTDTNHSHSSKCLLGVFTSTKKAISSIESDLLSATQESYIDHGYESQSDMLEDTMDNLNKLNQTQNLSTNYMLEFTDLNKTI